MAKSRRQKADWTHPETIHITVEGRTADLWRLAVEKAAEHQAACLRGAAWYADKHPSANAEEALAEARELGAHLQDLHRFLSSLVASEPDAGRYARCPPKGVSSQGDLPRPRSSGRGFFIVGGGP